MLRGIIFAWWVISLAALFFFHNPFFTSPRPSGLEDIIPADLLIDNSWQGIYLEDDLIGYANTATKILGIKEGGGYLLKNRINMRLPVLGVVQLLDVQSTANFSNDFSLRYFYLNLSSGEYFFRVDIERLKGKTYSLKLVSPFQESRKTILLDKSDLIYSPLNPLLVNFLPLKKKTHIKLLNPLNSQVSDIYLENLGRDTIAVQGEEINAYKILLDFEGVDSYAWVDDKGKIIKEEIMNFVFVKDDISSLFDKLSKQKIKNDLALYFSVDPQGHLEEGASYLKLSLRGIDFSGLRLRDLNLPRQKAYFADGRLILEITKKSRQNLGRRDLENYEDVSFALGDDFFIQSKDKKVKRLALEITNNLDDAYLKAEALSSWVFKNVRKVPTFSLPRTVDVLEFMSGDCNEHSVLYCGLARSVDIPCYVNLGLVYQKGKFFYHAWPSVFLGDWVDVDPTLGQFPADASHISLTRQDFKRQSDILKFLGKVKIEILEAGYD